MQVGRDLLVINLSSQSDASDLLGGMQPVQVGSSLVALSQTFAELLQATYPSGKNADFIARVHKFVRDKKWTKLLHAFDVALEKVRLGGRCHVSMPMHHSMSKLLQLTTGIVEAGCDSIVNAIDLLFCGLSIVASMMAVHIKCSSVCRCFCTGVQVNGFSNA